MSILQELHGTIDRLLFHNQENNYSVLVVHTEQKQQVTVCGYMPAVQPGEQVRLRGSWVTHPKFGTQFQAEQCTVLLPTTTLGLKKYLGSGLIKGIGPTYAHKLVDLFGTDVLTIIDRDPEQLLRVPGIGPKRVEMIVQAWKDQKEISHVMIFLQEKGVSTAFATKIYKKYGQQSIALIQENPYRLADEVWGIGFKTADVIAHNMGIAKDAPARIRSGVLHMMNHGMQQGHLYVRVLELKKQVAQLLELNDEHEPLLKQVLSQLYHEEKIKLISEQDDHYIALASCYYAEYGIAQKIKSLLQHALAFHIDSNDVYRQLSTDSRIILNEEQQRGITTCLQKKVTVITGGPGTGKTTLVKKLLDILDHYHISYVLAAPTGRAAKRMHESTGRTALTIHRLLEFDAATFRFTRNEQHALKLDVIIIDESSMLDVFVAHALLKAIPYHAHLVFIGDIYQLPAVGPGNVLHDLIASNQIPCIALQHIFRQAQDSLIIVNAHRVNNGEFPIATLPNAKKDFLFITEQDPERVPEHLRTIVDRILPSYQIAVADMTVLVPMNRGLVGTQTLNSQLQQLVNRYDTNAAHVTSGFYTYRLQDRVMQIRNNYDKHVFNGDIGIVHDINLVDQQLIVQFPDQQVAYHTTELDELMLAYAISIHKSQGSEYAAVIIPLFMQHMTLLQRNLVYTAITRAKQLCIGIGQPKAWAIAIKNNKGLIRKTYLQSFLATDLKSRI